MFLELVGGEPFSKWIHRHLIFLYMPKFNCLILDYLIYNVILNINVFDNITWLIVGVKISPVHYHNITSAVFVILL